MKNKQLIIILSYLLLFNGCVVEFVPNINENQSVLVVEGTITDQLRTNTIKLSKSAPLGINNFSTPLKACKVWITDDLGQLSNLNETKDGTYITDSTKFRGVPGRTYILHVIGNATLGSHNYLSAPVEMKPVPPIDSIYYEKKVYVTWPQPVEGCQIYLDTHDPANKCKYYRWNYTETWEFHIPYNVTNRICWISDNSDGIFIKNTDVLGEDKISKYPLYAITNPIDRLSVRYSILVNQYSLNEDEYRYWESLKNMSEQVGGLYDMIPSSVPSNVYCVEKPDEKVLGYFSVSAVSSKRIFIQDTFLGFNYSYFECITDTITGTGAIPGLNSSVWVIVDNSNMVPPKRYITDKIGCADCRARGSVVKPSFWNSGK